MRWFRSKRRKGGRDTDWDFFDGYPPNLRMRKLSNGVWEVRPATEEEMQEFLASEATFVSKLTQTPPGPLSPDDRSLADAEDDASASKPDTSAEKS